MTFLRSFIFLLGLLITATPIAAQQPDLTTIPLTLQSQNQPLHEILKDIESETGIRFAFGNATVRDIRVTCDCAESNLEAILDCILRGTGITYRLFEDRQIVLIPPPPKRHRDIRGYIYDADNGEPLPYADLSIPGTKFGTTSNADGYFILVDIPEAESQLLLAEYLGYRSGKYSLDDNNDPIRLVVRLTRDVLSSKRVTIEDRQTRLMKLSNLPAEIRFSPQQLSAMPRLGEEDLFRSLQLLPGISSLNDASSGLYIRGGTPQQNLILFDGMTIYHLDHLFGFFSAFNSNAIKDVRIFKGGFPAKYGGRTSGVIEMTGKTGDIDKTKWGVGANLLSGQGYLTLPLAGKGSLLLSGRRSYSDLITSPFYDNLLNLLFREEGLSGDDPTFQLNNERKPDFYFFDFNGKLNYLPGSRDVIALSMYASRDNLVDESFTEVDENIEAVTSQVENEWGNVGFSLKWSRIWSDRFLTNILGASATYSQFQDGADTYAFTDGINDSLAFRTENEVVSSDITINNEWFINADHTIEFGGGYSNLDIAYQLEVNDSVNIYETKRNGVVYALYMQDRWTPSEQLSIIAGGRSLLYGKTRRVYWEPRLAIEYKISEGFRVNGAFGHYHQFVKQVENEEIVLGNDGYFLADKTIEPDFSRHVILGLSYERRGYRFQTEAYLKDLSDINDITLNYRTNPNANIEDIVTNGIERARGIEFVLQKKSGRLNGWINYSLAKVESKLDQRNNNRFFPADQDRRHEIKIVTQYNATHWQLAASWLFASGTPFTVPGNRFTFTFPGGPTIQYLDSDEINGARLPEFHRMDLSITRKFSYGPFNYELGLAVFNVYNRRNLWYRRFVATNIPILVRDVVTLGFTPTLHFKMDLK